MKKHTTIYNKPRRRISRILDSKPILFVVSFSMVLYLSLSMIFWSQNSIKVHLKIYQELDRLIQEKRYYETKAQECDRTAEKLKDITYQKDWLYNHYLMTQTGQKIVISRSQ